MKHDDEFPPEVDYPEGHGPLCRRDCDHPCHRPYDEWKAREDARRARWRRRQRHLGDLESPALGRLIDDLPEPSVSLPAPEVAPQAGVPTMNLLDHPSSGRPAGGEDTDEALHGREWSVSDAAKILGVSESTVKRRCAEGKIPGSERGW